MPQSYTPEFKKKIVRLHEEEGRTYKSITAEYGVSKASISKWCSEFSKECQSSPEAKEDYDNMKEMLRLKRENEELLKATAEARTLMEQLPEDTSYVDADHAQIVNDARTAYDKLDKAGKNSLKTEYKRLAACEKTLKKNEKAVQKVQTLLAKLPATEDVMTKLSLTDKKNVPRSGVRLRAGRAVLR